MRSNLPLLDELSPPYLEAPANRREPAILVLDDALTRGDLLAMQIPEKHIIVVTLPLT